MPALVYFLATPDGNQNEQVTMLATGNDELDFDSITGYVESLGWDDARVVKMMSDTAVGSGYHHDGKDEFRYHRKIE